MSLSRGLSFLRQTKSLNKSYGPNIQQIRNSGGQFSYRCGPYPSPRSHIIQAEIAGGAMWFWIIYGVLTEPEHLIGEFEWPDVKAWTNEELGIPPDDAQ